MLSQHADILIKATNVDGIYTNDPKKDKSATKYDKLSYIDVLNKNIKVMDSTAITLCMENNIPIVVYDLNKKGDLLKVINGESIGTIIENSK